MRDAAVGVAGRPAADPPRRRHRRRLVGHRPRGRAGPRRRRGRPRHAHRRPGRRCSSATRVNDRYLPGEVLPETRQRRPSRRPRARPPRPRRPRRPRPRAARGHRRPRRRDHRPRRPARRLQGPRPAARRAAERLRRRALRRPRDRRPRRPGARRRRARPRRRAGRRAAPTAASAASSPTLLGKAGLYAETSTDTVGVELAGAAKNAAALAAATAGPAGPNAVGAAAGRVFAEVDAYARTRGAHAETFAGLAGTGDLIATVLASGSRNRRAGELLAAGTAPQDIEGALGQAAESLDALPLLALALREGGVDAPAVCGLADVVEGRVDAGDWASAITAPPRRTKRFVRAA